MRCQAKLLIFSLQANLKKSCLDILVNDEFFFYFLTMIDAMIFLSFLSFVGDFIEAIIFNFISCYLVRRLS